MVSHARRCSGGDLGGFPETRSRGPTKRRQGMPTTEEANDNGLQIVLPDPDQEDLLHSFSVESEIVRLLCSVLEHERMAANVVGLEAFARAVCGALVQQVLKRVDDEIGDDELVISVVDEIGDEELVIR